MKALLSALALSALMPALATAGPFDDLANNEVLADMELLEFTHEFSQVHDFDFPAFSGDHNERHWFGTAEGWLPPEFDYSLGTPEYLFLTLSGLFDIDIIIDGIEDNPVQSLRPLAMLPPGGGIIAFMHPEETGGQIGFGPDLGFFDNEGNRSGISIGLQGGDTFVVWPNELPGSVHVEFSGTAAAGYFYTPFETAEVPEPSSLILLGTGVAAAYRSRRRKRCPT